MGRRDIRICEPHFSVPAEREFFEGGLLACVLRRQGTMLVFGKARRALLAKQLSDVANLAMAALVFGQFISGRPLSTVALLWGGGLWFGLVASALAITEKENR